MKEQIIEKIELQDSYENQKKVIEQIAYDKFGSQYFEKLDELSKDYEYASEPDNYRYSLKINSMGAFNAC